MRALQDKHIAEPFSRKEDEMKEEKAKLKEKKMKKISQAATTIVKFLNIDVTNALLPLKCNEQEGRKAARKFFSALSLAGKRKEKKWRRHRETTIYM